MKTVNFLITALFTFMLSVNTSAQTHDHKRMSQPSTKTDSINVWGNCGMCKARIEKTAKIEGVSKAEWNKETKVLTLVYDPSKLKSDDIQKKIAASGHDTEKFKADDKTYNGLPACCHYDRKK